MPRDPDRAHPLLALVARLGERPYRRTAQPIHVVDQLLVRREAEIAVGWIRIEGEGPAADQRQQRDATEERAGEPGAPRDDDDHAADLPEGPPRAREHVDAGNDEDGRQGVERRGPAISADRVAGDRQRAERRRLLDAEDQQVLLRVVHRHVEGQRRAAPVIMRKHFDAGDDQDARVGRAGLRNARQVAVDPEVEHRALLADRAGQRSEGRQAVFDAQKVVLAEQQRPDPLLLGHRGELLEREVAGGQIGVEVEDRRQPVEALRRADDESPGDDGEQRGAANHASLLSRTNAAYRARSFSFATDVENASARARAASPSFRRSAGSRPSSISAAASASTSSGSTSRPHSPSVTTSGMPPTAVATTGSPRAIASTMTRPIPSFLDGMATTSAAARYGAISVVSP